MPALPLVLVPGLLCDAGLWAAQTAAFRDDRPCWVPDIARDDTMAAIARRVLAEAPFERFALAGLSMGGMVALAIRREAPARVERLALLDTNARPDTPERTRERQVFMALAQSERGFTTINGRMMARLVHPSRLTDEALVNAIDAMAGRVGLSGYLNQQRALIGRPDSRPDLPSIDCPTLVLCGREDILTPLDLHEEMAAGVLGARLVVVEQCGHMSTMEQPQAVNDPLRAWLD